MRTWLLVVVAMLLSSSASARSGSLRDRLELALSGLESLPSKHALLQISPHVDELLRDIVSNPSRRALARTRALVVLRHFPSTATTSTLRATIQRTAVAKGGVPLLDLQQALASYAVVVGPRSLPVLQPFLAHAHVDVRHAAAGAVVLSRSPSALSVLAARRKIEPAMMVRVELDRRMQELRAAPAK
jgi:hypothetical protein